MKARIVLWVFVFMLAAASVSETAEARPRPARATKRFEANKGFGLGGAVGVPSGLVGKYYLGADTALAFGVGGYYRYRYDSAVHIHFDFLWHPVVLASPSAFELPLYFGVGGRVLSHDRYRDDYNADTHVGVRAPIGIIFDFNRIPLDVFIELALSFDFIVDDDHPYLEIPFSAGVRYYFN